MGGKRKVVLESIAATRSRQITFSKRKWGLLKKAYELSTLCQCEIGLIIFSGNDKMYEYASTSMDSLLLRYTGHGPANGAYNNDSLRRKLLERQMDGEDGGDATALNPSAHTFAEPHVIGPQDGDAAADDDDDDSAGPSAATGPDQAAFAHHQQDDYDAPPERLDRSPARPPPPPPHALPLPLPLPVRLVGAETATAVLWHVPVAGDRASSAAAAGRAPVLASPLEQELSGRLYAMSAAQLDDAVPSVFALWEADLDHQLHQHQHQAHYRHDHAGSSALAPQPPPQPPPLPPPPQPWSSSRGKRRRRA